MNPWDFAFHFVAYSTLVLGQILLSIMIYRLNKRLKKK